MISSARPDKDGIDSAGFWFCGYVIAPDCELEESTTPNDNPLEKLDVDGGGQENTEGGLVYPLA